MERSPLTIAVSRPGENSFSKVFVIRRARHDGQPGESADHLSLAYPCGVEHDGYLSKTKAIAGQGSTNQISNSVPTLSCYQPQ